MKKLAKLIVLVAFALSVLLCSETTYAGIEFGSLPPECQVIFGCNMRMTGRPPDMISDPECGTPIDYDKCGFKQKQP